VERAGGKGRGDERMDSKNGEREGRGVMDRKGGWTFPPLSRILWAHMSGQIIYIYLYSLRKSSKEENKQ